MVIWIKFEIEDWTNFEVKTKWKWYKGNKEWNKTSIKKSYF